MASILAEIIMLVLDVASDAAVSNKRYNKKRSRGSSRDVPFNLSSWNKTRVPSTNSHQKKSIKTKSISSPNSVISKSSVGVESPASETLQAVEQKVVIPVILEPVVAIEKPIKTQEVIAEVESASRRTLSKPTLSKPHYSTKTHDFNVNRVKLEVLLLSYIYIEDDGKISFSEKTKLKTHFKSFKEKLDKEDLESVQELMIMEPSLDNIRAHVNQNEMDDSEVNDTLDTIQTICGMNKDYRKIMKRIRTSLTNTINN